MITITRMTLPALALLATAAVAQAQTPQQQRHQAHHPAAQRQDAAPAAPGMDMCGMMGAGGMMGQGGMMGMMQQMHGGSMPMMQGGAMPMGRGGMGMPFEHVEGRIAFLKAEIGITESQQKAWDAFAEALRARAGAMRAMHERMAQTASAEPVGYPDRMEAMAGMLSARAEAAKAVASAARTLYEGLSAEQRSKADSLLPGPMGMM